MAVIPRLKVNKWLTRTACAKLAGAALQRRIGLTAEEVLLRFAFPGLAKQQKDGSRADSLKKRRASFRTHGT